MYKVAVLSGRQKNGTLLPKSERFLWKEICRVMELDLSAFNKQNFEFLIPIYNKFDIEALRIAEKQGNKVTYYLPNPSWGTSRLPNFQLGLIRRMRQNEIIVPGRANDRIFKMIADADIVYVLPGTDGIEEFSEALLKKDIVCNLSTDKLLFQTEEAGEAYYKKLEQQTITYLTNKQINHLQDQKMAETMNDPVDMDDFMVQVFKEDTTVLAQQELQQKTEYVPDISEYAYYNDCYEENQHYEEPPYTYNEDHNDLPTNEELDNWNQLLGL